MISGLPSRKTIVTPGTPAGALIVIDRQNAFVEMAGDRGSAVVEAVNARIGLLSTSACNQHPASSG
jgi:isochorismate hydrolase